MACEHGVATLGGHGSLLCEYYSMWSLWWWWWWWVGGWGAVGSGRGGFAAAAVRFVFLCGRQCRRTPLHAAAARGRTDAVRTLVRLGAAISDGDMVRSHSASGGVAWRVRGGAARQKARHRRRGRPCPLAVALAAEYRRRRRRRVPRMAERDARSGGGCGH